MSNLHELEPLLEAYRDGILSDEESARIEAALQAEGLDAEAEAAAFGELLDFGALYPEIESAQAQGPLSAAAFAERGRWRSRLVPAAPRQRVSARAWILTIAAAFLCALGLALHQASLAPETTPDAPELPARVLGSGSGSGSGTSAEPAIEAAATGDVKITTGPEAAAGSGSGG